MIRVDRLWILQTPLFRVRNKKETIYGYDDGEHKKALTALGKGAEISRFKGLGEISPDEFSFMIGPEIQLEHVEYEQGKRVKELLALHMGKNTRDKQDYVIEELRDDVDKQVQVA
jgi:topoisomerase IV subunit B